MKKIWGLGVLALSCGLGLSQQACSSGTQGGTAPLDNVDHTMDDLIGSVPVSGKSLDGIGSIGYSYDYGYAGTGYAGSAGGPGAGAAGFLAALPASAGAGPAAGGSGPSGSNFYAQCTGTLISKNSVLTSRTCAQSFDPIYQSAPFKFAIGADPTQAPRLIDIVDVEYAPADAPYSYPDIAVLHLGESVTDVAAFPIAVLTDDLIGKQLAAVGYGNSDLRYSNGARRAGALTVRGTSGLLYPLIFPTFDAFYQFQLGSGYPYPGPWGSAGAASGGAPGIEQGAAILGGGGPVAGAGGSSAGAGGSVSAGAGGGGGEDWYRQYLQSLYDTTPLASGEAYLGGTDSDTQPCGADQGGPVVRKQQGQVRVLGVFSRTPFGGCEKGGIYSRITASSKAFIDSAAQWKDPCTGLSSFGKCTGTTATRCSTYAEGKRRAVKLDCALLNQICVGGTSTEVACSDKP